MEEIERELGDGFGPLIGHRRAGVIDEHDITVGEALAIVPAGLGSAPT